MLSADGLQRRRDHLGRRNPTKGSIKFLHRGQIVGGLGCSLINELVHWLALSE